MYILPALTYLEVGAPGGASKIFIFEHFNYEPIWRANSGTCTAPSAELQEQRRQQEHESGITQAGLTDHAPRAGAGEQDAAGGHS